MPFLSSSFAAVVTDDFGAMSTICKLDVEVTQKNLFILAEAGPLIARGSHGPYLAAGVGVNYFMIPDVLDVLVVGGSAIALKGDPWKSFFKAKALVNYHVEEVFFGAGFGFTTKVGEERNADFDLIANIGFDVFSNFTSKGAIFLEGRGPIGKDKHFKKHHKLMMGFRYFF